MLKSTTLLLLLAATAGPVIAGDWPQWRGPNRTSQATDEVPIIRSLDHEIKPVWRIKIGDGFASPIVAKNRLVYTDNQAGKEVVHVLNATDGKEIWNLVYDDVYGDEWGEGPRSTPFIDGDRLYVQSCRGEFLCLGFADGKVRWKTNFDKDFGVSFVGSKAQEGTASRRGNNGCGLVDGDAVIVPVGSISGATLVCFDKLKGSILWKTGHEEAAYSSLMMAEFGEKRQVVALMADSLMGVDRKDGKILWHTPLKTSAKRHASTPVIIGDSVAVNSHSFGLICFQIARTGDNFEAKQKWANRNLKINVATPVLVDGFLYSQGANKDFVSVDANTGRLAWSQIGFGTEYSSAIAVGHELIILNDLGELVLIEADSQRYQELGRMQVCGKTWSSPAFSNGKLFIRDRKELVCLDLASNDHR